MQRTSTKLNCQLYQNMDDLNAQLFHFSISQWYSRRYHSKHFDWNENKPICKLFNWVCKPWVCIIPHGKPSCHISVHDFHVTISQSDHLNRLLNIECRFDSTTSLLKWYSILYCAVKVELFKFKVYDNRWNTEYAQCTDSFYYDPFT